jgi:hypothetical protein
VESETNQVLFELARLVGAGIVGGLIASFANHRLTLSRERESGRRNRQRDFRSFVVQFRSEAADRHHPPHTFATFYQNKVPNLRHAAATVRDDFPRRQRAEFDTLISTAAGFTGAQADDGDTGKQRIIDSLDAILRFLDA